MKFLTSKQKHWITTKTIKVGMVYSFPPFGFFVYLEPNYHKPVNIDTNPFTRSLAHEMFLVKEIIDGFCKGNFYGNSTKTDVYITESDLSTRTILEMLILLVISFIPLAIYNLFLGGVNKIEAKKTN